MKKIFLISAIVVLALAAAGAVYAFSPAGHLSIDVNPSFELTFNRVNRVVKVQGLNPEAKALLANNEFHPFPSGVHVFSLIRAQRAMPICGSSMPYRRDLARVMAV